MHDVAAYMVKGGEIGDFGGGEIGDFGGGEIGGFGGGSTRGSGWAPAQWARLSPGSTEPARAISRALRRREGRLQALPKGGGGTLTMLSPPSLQPMPRRPQS